MIHRFPIVDARLSRGGPVLGRVPFNDWSLNISSDNRRKIVLNGNAEVGCTVEHYCNKSVGLSAQVKPRSNVLLSVGPSWFQGSTPIQYVTAITDATASSFYGKRYVFADLGQSQLSLDTRLNVTFSTNLTLEL